MSSFTCTNGLLDIIWSAVMATVDRPIIARRLAFWRLSDHSFVDDSQPAQFHFLIVSSKTVDGFGLAQTEACWRMIRWSLDVLNLVTQEGNRTLGFDILEKVTDSVE